MRKRTKTVTLTFKREALLYDIENCAYIEGDVMPEVTAHNRHQTIDIAQDGNVDRVTRILDQAFAECVEFMYPYTKEACEKVELRDNVLSEAAEYIVNLYVDDDFSQTTVNLISKLIHEYMICRVLSEWLSITYPASQAKWEVKAEGIKDQIRTRLNARCGRVRRTQTPF